MIRSQRFLFLCVLLTMFVLTHVSESTADWPELRGPDGQGHATGKGLPIQWSEEKNVAWKVPIPGKGWSSPVVVGSQIWLTTATEKGRSLRAICLSRQTGKLLHNVELFESEQPAPSHVKNSHATPTPVISNNKVFVHFGSAGTACLSTQGKILWKNTSLRYHQPYAGASSPILFRKFLILTCDGSDVQFVAALDKDTGKVLWRTPRGHLTEARKKNKRLMAYSTPLVIEVEGSHHVVSPGAEHVAAYDVFTGKEIWWTRYDGFSLVARPVSGNGLVFVVGVEGAPRAALYAIDCKALGEIPREKLVWRLTKGIPHVPSPLLIENQLYLITDKGMATCLDSKSGKTIWKKRIGGNFSASPVYAEGRILLMSEEGKGTILVPGTQYKELTSNQLAGRFLASPAISGDALILRSESHLYCIRKKR